MTHTHERRRFGFLRNEKVRSVLRFVMEYSWLFYGLAFLTGIFVRTGMGWLAFPALLVWSLGINHSKYSRGGEWLKDFISHVPWWLVQHGVSFIAMMTLLRANWTGLSVFATLVCVTGPMLSLFQFLRWYLARVDTLATIARAVEAEEVH